MTDIDTIREALEEYRLTGLSPRGFVTAGAQKAESALAALERVSALNSEMEAALEHELKFYPEDSKRVPFLKSLLTKSKESR